MSGEIVLGVASGTRDGKPIVITQPKRCDGVTTGQYYTGLVSGTRDGKPVIGFSTQRCGDGGILVNGQTYIGLVSGTRDGKPILVVPCGACPPDTECDTDCCTDNYDIPDTLTATVDVGCMDPFTVTLNRVPGDEDPDAPMCGPAPLGTEDMWGWVRVYSGTYLWTGPGGIVTENHCVTGTDTYVLLATTRRCDMTLACQWYEEDGCIKTRWVVEARTTDNTGGLVKHVNISGKTADSSTTGIAEYCVQSTPCNPNATITCDPFSLSASGTSACTPAGGDNAVNYETDCSSQPFTVEVTE